MSTLTGISSYTSAASYLFSKIDTSGKGYINEDDLVSAFSSLTSTSETNASDVFTQLDSDSDGKITESEFSSALQALNSQYDASRMQGAMPPPPPPADDEGFTEDELTSQLEEIGDTDSARSTLISSILENFDAADTDGDGKVNGAEAMSYADANSIATSSASSTSSTTTASTSGFTAEELTTQLDEIGSTDSVRSSLISSIIENFDAADTNQDGTVSNTEAMAYAKANDITTNASSNSSSSSSSDSGNTSVSDARVYQQIMELMRAYGPQNGSDSFLSSLSSAISTSA